MAEDVGCCCKCMIAVLSAIFKAVGASFCTFGGWLESIAEKFDKENFNSFLFHTFSIILIFQGTVMIGMGAVGIYKIKKNEGISLKKFSVFLAVLALADIVIGVVLYYKCAELKMLVLEFYNNMYNHYKDYQVFVDDLKVIHTLLFCCGKTEDPVNEGLKDVCPTPDWPIMNTCPKMITFYSEIFASCVMAIFLGTAALVFIALGCITIIVKKTERNNQDYTAHFSAVA